MDFFEIVQKVEKNRKDFPVKWTQIKFKRNSLIIFVFEADQFLKDFPCKIEGDFNFLVNFFFVGISLIKFKLISFFIARYLTDSLRGPVLKQNYKRIPFKLNLGSFYREIICIFFDFSTISKKSNLEGIFEFFYSDPQIDQNLKPPRNLCGQLLYLYIWLVFNIS